MPLGHSGPEKMGKPGPGPHPAHPRINWVQAHGMRETLDRRFRLAEKVFYPAAESPCLGQVGIEPQRPID